VWKESSADKRKLKERQARGGLTVIQDPATARSPIMIDAALAACRVDKCLPLSEIVPYLISLGPAESKGKAA
jgi:two-component system chemotaxis response regulator CheB